MQPAVAEIRPKARSAATWVLWLVGAVAGIAVLLYVTARLHGWSDLRRRAQLMEKAGEFPERGELRAFGQLPGNSWPVVKSVNEYFRVPCYVAQCPPWKKAEAPELVQALDSAGCNLTDHDLADLPKTWDLRQASVRGRTISEAGLSHLSQFRRLAVLEYHGVISGEAFQHWNGPLAKLSIPYAGLSHRGCEAIARLRSLKHLKLQSNSLDGRKLWVLAHSDSLEVLDLSFCNVDDEMLDNVLGSPALKRVNVYATFVTAPRLAALARRSRIEFTQTAPEDFE